jgi:hypothetical protein
LLRNRERKQASPPSKRTTRNYRRS